jgi:hypothetical protein
MEEKKVRKVFLEELPKYTEGRCKGKINWKECISSKIKFVYDNIEGWIEIINYITKGQILVVLYEYEEYKIKTSCFLKSKVGNIIGTKTSAFKIEIGTRFQDDKRDITITDRKKIKDKSVITRKYYKYKCKKCGFDCGEHYKGDLYQDELWIDESHLNNHGGCSCCDNKVVVENINSIVSTSPWMIPYFQNGYDEAKMYTYNSHRKIYPICPSCSIIKNKPMIIGDIYRRHSIGCTCSDGIKYPNKFSYELLNQLDNIYNFYYIEHEYSPDWIEKMSYDNYFIYNNKKYIIEMDGQFHNNDNKMSGQTKEESKAIDNYKDEQARLHGIKVIRIDCDYRTHKRFEFIKQNIVTNKTLNKLFDLNKIDWNRCNEFALSNLAKEICEMKNNNPELTTTTIVEEKGIDRSTIIEWLKSGNKLGWCHYDSDEEKQKNNKNNGIRNQERCSKQVEIFKDGISLGIFPSATELERQSIKRFGTKLIQSMISTVCLGKRKQYKGYTFQYI